MGKIIQHLPNYDIYVSPIPTPGIEPLLENDIRLDKELKLKLDHVDIIILDQVAWGSYWWNEYGSSSSATPTYPMADVDIVSPTNSATETYLSQEIISKLPGDMGGEAMSSLNYLTYPAHLDVRSPGDFLEPSSSSS